MKSIISALALTIALTANNVMTEPTKLLDDIDSFNEHCSGMSYETVHSLFGEPQGRLSGFWGDIYFDSDNEAVIIYYNSDGSVDFAKMGNWTKPEK